MDLLVPRVGIREQQKTYPVRMLCRVLEVSTSAYYSWIKQPETTDKIHETQRLEAKVRELFDEFRQSYGLRRLSNELRKAGFNIGRYQTRTLMKRLGLIVRYPKKFKATTDSNHNNAISPNRLNRKFDVMAPNKVWTTDIIYVWTLEGWLYVAIVIDLFSR